MLLLGNISDNYGAIWEYIRSRWVKASIKSDKTCCDEEDSSSPVKKKKPYPLL